MNCKRLVRWCCALAVMLCCALPVAADEPTTTTAATTTTTVATTTTAATTTATTTAATTTTVTTTTAAPTTTVAGTTTTVNKAATTTAANKATTTAASAGTTAGTTATSGTKGTSATTTTITTATTTTVPYTTTTGVIVNHDIAEPIVIVGEPTDIDDKVYQYVDKQKVSNKTFSWESGKFGQALKLNGEKQYLRYSAKSTLQLEEFTLSAWVNWQGGEPGQKLLTVYKNESRFLTVSPYTVDEEKGINGFYMEWQDREIDPVILYTEAKSDTNFALEKNAWHHIAVVASDTEFSLYLDGALYYTAAMDLSLADMEMNTFLVGGGFYGEPTLNALLDETYLYPQALSREYIALLAAGMYPAYGGTAPTTEAYRPTAPSATTTLSPADGNVPHRATLFGLPRVLVIIPLTVAVLAVVLSLVLSAQKKQQTASAQDEEGTVPLIGEPEAPQDPEEEEEQA